MFAHAALALTIALAAPGPQDMVAPWGQHEWDNGAGFLSRHYFENRTGFPSGHQLENGTGPGTIHHLISGTGAGSAHAWLNGYDAGSAHFWENGYDPGSRHYWANGRGCLSEFGWRAGAACTSGEAVVFQILCIARAVQLDPCRAINARLDDWLSRDTDPFTGAPGLSSEAVARMRERID